MHKKVRIKFTILFVLVSAVLFAQNNTNSPYTRFGYGEIAENSSAKCKAMGGTSIGIRSNGTINTANPASYTSVDSLTFMFDFGGSAQISKQSTSLGSVYAYNANIEYVTMQFPLKNWLAASAGLLPYSFVGYDISQTYYAPDSTKYKQVTVGTGSINQAYIGLSAKIGKHLAVGVNTSYLFGSVEKQDTLSFYSESFYEPTIKESTLSVRDVNFRYGLQYFTDLENGWKLNTGLIYENKAELSADYSVGISDLDTISSDYSFESPMLIGTGLSFEYKDKMSFGADLLYQNWSDAKFFGVTDSLNDKYKVSIGGDYLPSKNSRKYLDRIRYSFGAYATNDYLKSSTNLSNYGVSCGFALPSKGNSSTFNLGFEYGKVGNTSNNQIREDYFKLLLNITFNETWFFKRRFE